MSNEKDPKLFRRMYRRYRMRELKREKALLREAKRMQMVVTDVDHDEGVVTYSSTGPSLGEGARDDMPGGSGT